MKRQLTWMAMIILAVFVLGGTSAMAGKFGHGRCKGEERGIGFKGLRHLDLTPQQRNEVEAALSKYRSELDGYRQQARDARQQLTGAIHGETLDLETVGAKFDESARLRKEMVLIRAKMVHEIRGILTPDQISQWESQRSRREQKWRNRMQSDDPATNDVDMDPEA